MKFLFFLFFLNSYRKKKSNSQMTVSHTASCLHRKRRGPGWSSRGGRSHSVGRMDVSSISSGRMWKSFEFPLFSSVSCTKYYIFKHIIYRVRTNRKWLQITTRLGKITAAPPPTHWGQVWQTVPYLHLCLKKSEFLETRRKYIKTAKHHQFIQASYPGNRYQLVHVSLPE